MWSEDEIRAIVPRRVDSILGHDISIVYYDTEGVKHHDLHKYNSGVMAEANLFTRDEPDYGGYIGSVFEELGITPYTLEEVFSTQQDFDEQIGARPKQALLQCIEGKDEILSLHLVETGTNMKQGPELFLQDILLQDPNGASQRRLPGQQLPGMGRGIFGELMANLGHFAISQGYPRVALTAATRDHVPVFLSVGYELDNRFPEFLDLAKDTNVQYPMVREL